MSACPSPAQRGPDLRLPGPLALRGTETTSAEVDTLSIHACVSVPLLPIAHGSDAMDCKTVRSLLVPYLDGELAKAQVSWIDAHLAGCECCSAIRNRLEAQSEKLAALPPPAMPDGLARDLFARMDAELDAELDQLTHVPVPSSPVRPQPAPVLSRMSVVAYATVLGAALAWGWWSHEVAADALGREEAMRVQLERAERLRAVPLPLPSAQLPQYRTVSHSPGRGHL